MFACQFFISFVVTTDLMVVSMAVEVKGLDVMSNQNLFRFISNMTSSEADSAL